MNGQSSSAFDFIPVVLSRLPPYMKTFSFIYGCNFVHIWRRHKDTSLPFSFTFYIFYYDKKTHIKLSTNFIYYSYLCNVRTLFCWAHPFCPLTLQYLPYTNKKRCPIYFYANILSITDIKYQCYYNPKCYGRVRFNWSHSYNRLDEMTKETIVMVNWIIEEMCKWNNSFLWLCVM